MRKLLAAITTIFAMSAQNGASPFLGRWDITITGQNGSYPDWMEVVEKDGALSARVQPRGGSVHPVAGVKVDGSRLLVTVSAANARSPEVTWDLSANGDRLTGTQKRGDNTAQVAGVRAPALKRNPPKAWSKPEALFNGKDLTGWEPVDHPENNHWIVQDGAIVNESKGANLRSTRKFDDFKLHIEFNCPDNGNSGIYL